MSKEPGTGRCGTPAGYLRHQRRRDKPCNACAAAKAIYDQRQRSAPEKVQRHRLRARAQQQAYRLLCAKYPDEYRVLYEAAVVELFAENGLTQ